MSATGPLLPTVGTDNAATGTLTWANPSRITLEDGSVAQTSIPGSASTSHWLVGSSFGFSVDSHATILGIQIEWKKNATNTVHDAAIRLVKATVIGSTDRSSAAAWTTGALAWSSYGSSTDLWGVSLGPADINSTGFGCALSATVAKLAQANVDAARITVYYDAGIYGSQPSRRRSQTREVKLKRLPARWAPPGGQGPVAELQRRPRRAPPGGKTVRSRENRPDAWIPHPPHVPHRQRARRARPGAARRRP